MKRCIVFFLVLVMINAYSQKDKKVMARLIKENMDLAVKQYKYMASLTPVDSMPRSFDANRFIASNTDWWTSGFFPGTLWYIYEYSKNTSIKAEAERRLAILEKEKYYTGNHDLGFMIYCSFGNAYRITGVPAYKDVVTTAAETLIKRYRPTIRAIQSWNSLKDTICPVIIDNMMNLELLNWVSDELREPKYKVIAIDHANTTLKNHFRADNSSYHVLDYAASDGGIVKKKTAQGYSDESAWARGQSWGLYGYNIMYRFTKEPAYLEQARKIAAFLVDHPTVPADKIPYWDYNAPITRYTYRDVSAASIMASALLELAQYTSEEESKKYIQRAVDILKSLSTPTYRAEPGSNGGFILKHSVGSLPHKSEVDVPLTYADYYFIEALLRYKKWYLND
ncbi:glycoside hydrolase family 88 protein [Terrimonas pollutisoli]|uniref:glycoside hydrolase family 88 protein n=1 Tax=Terrimonas pollutisoli TaxID=3034147 RepID=UPI0023EBA1E3|nr:glycoside hydrolase family 88 protein [Terrimonas sp. H1YJ31]